MMIFYFYLVCFTFSVLYSVLPFHRVYISQFLCLFLLLVFFLNAMKFRGKMSLAAESGSVEEEASRGLLHGRCMAGAG